MTDSTDLKSLGSKEITLDLIIEKFIPIIWGLFLAVGIGYLLYTSVWIHLLTPVRLWLGFFLSLCIIGWWYSMPNRMQYLSDVIIGIGVLVFYGTLIYGSRASDSALQVIPEIATLVSGILFTAAVAYLANMRNSKVILILGIIWAYITPFVIGTNDSWVQTISFNSYLLYFVLTNAVIFYLGKTVGVRDILPLNLIWLYTGTISLYLLSYNGKLATDTVSIAGSENISLILFFLTALLSAVSINTSSKEFRQTGDTPYLVVGYLLPTLWFILSASLLANANDILKSVLCMMLGISYIGAWYLVKDTLQKAEIVTVYSAGILTIASSIFFVFPDMTAYLAVVISYISFVFGALYLMHEKREERLWAYLLFAFFGGLFTLIEVFGSDSQVVHTTFWAVIGLIPSIAFVFLANSHINDDVKRFGLIYSISTWAIAFVLLISEFITKLDSEFMFYILPGFIAVVLSSRSTMSDAARGNLLRSGSIWMLLGFVDTFFILLGWLYPAPLNTSLFGANSIFLEWLSIKAIIVIVWIFIGLDASRKLQLKNQESRPSFLLVIIGYTTLLLFLNYLANAFINDLWVDGSSGGPRAIVTTIIWLSIAIWMLVIGIRKEELFKAEKFLGLLLLAITITKVLFYDLETMSTDKKIIVLMIVGWGLMAFSYFVQQNGWLKSANKSDA